MMLATRVKGHIMSSEQKTLLRDVEASVVPLDQGDAPQGESAHITQSLAAATRDRQRQHVPDCEQDADALDWP